MKLIAHALALAVASMAVSPGGLTIEEVAAQPGQFTFDYENLAPPAGTKPAFGYDIDVQGDYIAVSSPDQSSSNDGLPGVVYLYRKTGGLWQYTQTLVPYDAVHDFQFGESVDFSDDGTVLVVGSDDQLQGSNPAFQIISGAYVYRLDPVSGRFRFEQKLVADGSSLGDICGYRTAVSGDWIAVGCLSTGKTAIFEYSKSSSRWIQRQEISRGGHGLAISGSNLAIEDGGSVQLYRLGSGANPWEAEGPTLDGEIVDLKGDRLLLGEGFNSIPKFYDRNPAGSWALNAFDLAVAEGPVNYIYGFSGEVLFLEEEDGATQRMRAYRDSGSPLAPQWTLDSTDAPVQALFFPSSFSTAADAHTVVAAGDAGIDVYSTSSATPLDPIRGLLFHDNAPAGQEANAAFAYQKLLYEDVSDPGDPPSFLTRHDQLDAADNPLYGSSNRANADAAEALLRTHYPSAPPSQKSAYEHLFLDLAYGRTAAQLIISKETLRDLNRRRVEAPGGDQNDLFIDTEIGIVESALEQSTKGLNRFFALFEDDLGVPPLNGDPAGRVIFQRHVPNRALVSAIDPDDPHDPLLTGYKDLALVYDLLLHHARTSSQLAYLLTARNEADDADTTNTLIGDTQRFIFEQRLLLDAMFPQLTGAERSALGLDILAEGIDAALNELTAFEQNLAGTINLLGYEPDFLMLFGENGTQEDLSSFGYLTSFIDPDPSNLASPLKIAIDSRNEAIDDIAAYGNNQDALAAEFSLIANNATSALVPRLNAIVGVNPGDPGYDTPQNNVGSEIWQQINSMEIATQRIRRNRAEIANLSKRIHIEWERRATEAGINAALSSLIIDYGEQQASMTEEISRIEAVQAASDSLTELFEVEKIAEAPFKLFAGVVNAGVQAGGEVGKGNLEASKERLAAAQEAAVRDADDDILDNNSKALVKTLFLEMNTLAIDSQEAALLFRQEAGRLTSLIGEKEDLERRLAEVNEDLAGRYFADPIHRLRALYTTELANLRFREARQWLFFAARAAEYKWNAPFNQNGFSTTDLFKLRNAAELKSFYTALDVWDFEVSGNRSFDPHDDWFSLREDYFGYRLNDDSNPPQPIIYDAINPVTGELESVGAIQAFRWELLRRHEDCDEDANKELCLRFDTIRRNKLNTSGIEPEYEGNLFSPLAYLDRLDQLQIFLRGDHAPGTVNARLSYFGTSVIRRESAGTPADPVNRPDLIAGEFTSYPTRYYRLDTSVVPNRYRFEEGLSDKQAEALKITSARPRNDFEINNPNPSQGPDPITRFRERSVATSDWLLNLSLSEADIMQLDDIELYIIHNSVQR